MDHLKAKIRHVPDFPKPGILFYDITTLLSDARGFRDTVDALASPYMGEDIDVVVGIESRGFILGAAVAATLGCGFVPIRKPGKLPAKTVKATYALEYGTDSLEIHDDAVRKGERVLLVDDVLATGGTAEAAVSLVKGLGADLRAAAFLIELNFLNGRSRLPNDAVYSVLQY
ncbi:MAG: adenine phosphoribosyltransferase [Acidobacteria bacterium]|nr:adenine phosphoribosyltransferase [Acidobacteriota bacterium]